MGLSTVETVYRSGQLSMPLVTDDLSIGTYVCSSLPKEVSNFNCFIEALYNLLEKVALWMYQYLNLDWWSQH